MLKLNLDWSYLCSDANIIPYKNDAQRLARITLTSFIPFYVYYSQPSKNSELENSGTTLEKRAFCLYISDIRQSGLFCVNC